MFAQNPPERKLRKAVASLLATHPFFGTLTLRMPIYPGQVKTIAGDGQEFAYNAEWVADATHDEIKGCMAHIVFACALKHQFRRGERDYKKWQKASRYATAPMLDAEDIWVPDDTKMGAAMAGLDELPVEVIYDRLPDDDDGKQDGQQPSPQPQADPFAPDQPPGDGQGQDGEQDPFAPEPGDGQEDGQDGDNGDDSANSGQGPGGGTDNPDPQNGSDSPPDPGDVPGEVQDAPGDADEQQKQERQWDRASKQAAAAAKAVGTDPGAIEQMFEDQHSHMRGWEERLREYMQSIAATDYTWSRPNRRHIDTGLYLPSLHGEGMGPIVIAIDTSASVDDAYINRAVSNVLGIAREVEPERVWIIQCDARVQDVMDFDAFEPPSEILIKGRGGTAFQPAFEKVEEMEITPDVLIYFTDLMGPVPDEPDYPVMWAVETDAQLGTVPFGDSIVVPKEEE